MPPVGFEPTIPASEWPQIYALECGATGIDLLETTAKGNIYYETALLNVLHWGKQCLV